MEWREKITAERNLFEVYKKARKVGSSRSNSVAAGVVFVCFLMASSIDYWLSLGIFPLHALGSLLGRIADLGFTLTTAILGFLITGFSIFSSITRPEIFVALAKLNHRNSGLSRLQFIFFNFLLVFVHYLAFLAASIALTLGLPFAPSIARTLADQCWLSEPKIWWLTVGLSSVLISWLVYLIMLLKSFIWNIYQAILVVIVTGDLFAQLEKDQRDARSKPSDGEA